LLRVLQNHEIERVEGTEAFAVDIRIIAATNRNLEEMVKKKEFNEDLWLKLNVFPITFPPLRERKLDIPSLAQHFINRKSGKLSRSGIPVLAPGVIDTLMAYHWPGNFRELENIVERALILNHDDSLTFDSLIQPTAPLNAITAKTGTGEFYSMDEMIIHHIKKAIQQTEGRIQVTGGAAELLKMNPNTLRSKMRKRGIKTHHVQ